jgi:uracil-DNA glycosylase
VVALAAKDAGFPGAAGYVPDGASLSRLRRAVQECRGCDLYEEATQAVLGAGPARAALMVIGEQPGDQEDRTGKPFVGPAGKLLDQALDASGIAPASVFRTNAVKHFRFRGTSGKRRIHQSPSLAQMRACAPWLTAELARVRPTGAVLLGATAGKAVFGSDFTVAGSRGRLVPWPEQREDATPPEWALATVHPSSVLRSDDRDTAFDALVHDLRVAADALAAT